LAGATLDLQMYVQWLHTICSFKPKRDESLLEMRIDMTTPPIDVSVSLVFATARLHPQIKTQSTLEVFAVN